MPDVTCSSVWIVSQQYESRTEERLLLNPVRVTKVRP